MIRPTDQDIIAIEKRVCYTHKSQMGGGCPPSLGMHEESPIVRRYRERKKPWARACVMVCMEGRGQAR